jgi:hypothetical protein
MANVNDDEALRLVRALLSADAASEEDADRDLLEFAMRCPDPARAMDLLIQPGGPETPEAIVELVMNFPPRDPKSLSTRELHKGHPLRHMVWTWRARREGGTAGAGGRGGNVAP